MSKLPDWVTDMERYELVAREGGGYEYPVGGMRFDNCRFYHNKLCEISSYEGNPNPDNLFLRLYGQFELCLPEGRFSCDPVETETCIKLIGLLDKVIDTAYSDALATLNISFSDGSSLQVPADMDSWELSGVVGEKGWKIEGSDVGRHFWY